MMHAPRLLVMVLPLVACGPNYRYVYDGEAAFERCYALDYDDGANAATRQQCWSAWLQSYAFGAGADRVEYARSHANGQGTPVNGAQPRPAATAPMSPTPTQTPTPQELAHLHGAPRPTQTPAGAAWQREQISVGGNPIAAPPPTEAPAALETEPPGTSCANDCHSTWHTCGVRCTGNDAACVARCDDTYRECMRGCY